jgi:hypothetical protein|tara:strand:- start:8 stop:220 length:213 start_codon:yes stop_codon:yes gene_type:complete
MEIKERANNKIWAKITTAEFYLKDLQKEYRKGHYLGMLTEEQMQNLISSAQIELEVLNYIYKLLEVNYDR